eukprot:jgi/Botrbrau1/17705/Bobra.0166s0129.1
MSTSNPFCCYDAGLVVHGASTFSTSFFQHKNKRWEFVRGRLRIQSGKQLQWDAFNVFLGPNSLLHAQSTLVCLIL